MRNLSSNVQRRDLLFWGLFVCLILMQFLLFRTYAIREVVGYYPRDFDQSLFLSLSYQTYENILQHGLAKGVVDSYHPPTGILMPLVAAFFFLLSGASRFSALLLNFGFFVALQIVMIRVLRDLGGKYGLCLLMIGLLLTVNTPFFRAGGMMDFRIDFIALCLFGIFVSVVTKSHFFLLRKWSLIAGLIASILILFRYLAAAYIIPILCAETIYLVLTDYGLWRSQHPEQRKRLTVSRLKNLFLCSGTIAAIVFPFIWINRSGIYNYYVVGHVVGEEKNIRAAEQAITNLTSNVLYYPRSVLFDHIGLGALIIICVTLALGLVAYFINGQNGNHSTASEDLLRKGFVFFAICILAPILVLMLDTSKSPVVGNIVVAPLLWVVIWIQFFLDAATRGRKSKVVFNVVVAVVLLYGVGYQISHFGRHSNLYDRNMSGVTNMYEDIASYCRKVGLFRPRISVDRIRDYLAAPILSSFCYEINGVLLDPASKIGNSIFEITRDEALRYIKESDIAIIALSTYPDRSVYPFDMSMKDIRSIMKKAINKEFLILGDYEFDESRFRVYVRPHFSISGLSGDWVTSEGVILNIPRDVAVRASEVILEGTSEFEWISPGIRTYAEVISRANSAYPNRTLATRMTVSGRNYSIVCSLPLEVVDGQELRIRLTFSEYFVPKDLGVSEDSRKLVIRAPKNRRIILR